MEITIDMIKDLREKKPAVESWTAKMPSSIPKAILMPRSKFCVPKACKSRKTRQPRSFRRPC